MASRITYRRAFPGSDRARLLARCRCGTRSRKILQFQHYSTDAPV